MFNPGYVPNDVFHFGSLVTLCMHYPDWSIGGDYSDSGNIKNFIFQVNLPSCGVCLKYPLSRMFQYLLRQQHHHFVRTVIFIILLSS
jgi:hypothetical protein